MVSVLMAASGCAGTEGPLVVADLEQRNDARLWLSDSQGHSFVLDTGTPRTILDPSVLGLPPGTFEIRPVPVADWSDRAGLNDGLTPLVIGPPHAALPLDGIIGMDLLSKHRLAWDGALHQLALGTGAARWARKLDLDLLGGGTTCEDETHCYDFPATRMIVDIEIEGQPMRALVDTGTRDITVFTDALSRLPAMNRPERVIEATDGAEIHLTRFGSLAFGDYELKEVAGRVLEVSSSVERLRVETGEHIDALLGSLPLAMFKPVFAVAERKIELAEVDDGKHGLSNYVGITFGGKADGSCLRVLLVARGLTAYQNGLRVGDCVTAFGKYTQVTAANVAKFLDEAPGEPLGTAFPITVLKDGVSSSFDIFVEQFMTPPTGEVWVGLRQ
ncbi:MAG: aspartyl protease family protein [Myxococcota bacterium]